MERHGQTDGYNDEVMKEVLKICCFIIYFISSWPKTVKKRGFCTSVTDGWTDRQMDRPTVGPTDRPSHRYAFLTDTSKKELAVNLPVNT